MLLRTRTRKSSNVRDTRGYTIRARTAAVQWFAYTYGEYGVWKRERERETTKRKENKKDEKKRAFAQHLPDYSFRRPGGFTDGKRVRQRQSSREKKSEKRTDQGHGDHRSPGIRTYLQIYLSWFGRAGKLKGQTMYARYSVRTRWATANLMISSYSSSCSREEG